MFFMLFLIIYNNYLFHMVWVLLIFFIIILCIFPKQLLTVIGFVGAYFGLNYLNDEKQENAVIITVSYDLKSCQQEFPLHMTINNQSSRVLKRARWHIEAYEKGYSTNLIRYSEGE